MSIKSFQCLQWVIWNSIHKPHVTQWMLMIVKTCPEWDFTTIIVKAIDRPKMSPVPSLDITKIILFSPLIWTIVKLLGILVWTMKFKICSKKRVIWALLEWLIWINWYRFSINLRWQVADKWVWCHQHRNLANLKTRNLTENA